MKRRRVYAVLFACFGFLAVANAVVGYRSGEWSTLAVGLTAAGGTVTFLCALATAVRPVVFAEETRPGMAAVLAVGVVTFAVGTVLSVL
jgi:hypothetical protein